MTKKNVTFIGKYRGETCQKKCDVDKYRQVYPTKSQIKSAKDKCCYAGIDYLIALDSSGNRLEIIYP